MFVPRNLAEADQANLNFPSHFHLHPVRDRRRRTRAERRWRGTVAPATAKCQTSRRVAPFERSTRGKIQQASSRAQTRRSLRERMFMRYFSEFRSEWRGLTAALLGLGTGFAMTQYITSIMGPH